MLNLLLASPRPAHFEAFTTALSDLHLNRISSTRDGRTTLDTVRKAAVDLVVVDTDLGDMGGADLVRRLIEVNALIHTVLVSADAPEDFHLATEGLGILMQLPPDCGQAEAVRLMACLEELGLTRSRQPR